MAFNFCLYSLIGLSMIYTAYSMSFVITLPAGKRISGDIDDLDQIHAGKVRARLNNPEVIEWATRNWHYITQRHPELRSISASQLTNPKESLTYLEDLIQESSLDVQAFVEDLFEQAGMHLEIHAYVK